MKYGEIFAAACEYAPLELSDALVKAENGYDNSGIIIETEKEIAKVLIVSTHTSKAHVSNILYKLNVDSRIKAAVFAVKNGLV